MASDLVTVPADTLHAFLAVFARIDQVAKSPAVGELRDAVRQDDRARALLVALSDHLPAVLDALRDSIADHRDMQSLRGRYEAAYTALGGET